MSTESVMLSNHLILSSAASFSFCLLSFPNQSLFQGVASLQQGPKVLELQL